MNTEPTRAEDVLPGDRSMAEINGVTVRKGTIGAFLTNVQALSDLPAGAPQHSAVIAELRDSVEVLRSIGLFDVFCLRDAQLARALGVEDGGPALLPSRF